MVFVVDAEMRPLDPCHPARARRLLAQGKAAVWRRYPFILILRRGGPNAEAPPLRGKLHPGRRGSRLAVVHHVTGQGGGGGKATPCGPPSPPAPVCPLAHR